MQEPVTDVVPNETQVRKIDKQTVVRAMARRAPNRCHSQRTFPRGIFEQEYGATADKKGDASRALPAIYGHCVRSGPGYS